MPIPSPSNAYQVYHGPLLKAYQWEQDLFDGSKTTFECITRPDTVSVLAFLDTQTILLTKQHQPGKPTFFDLPGGRVDNDEPSITAAHRELTEETGYVASIMIPWSSTAHHGLIRYENSFYIAHALQFYPDKRHLDAGEDIEIIPISWSNAITMCLQGEWRQSTTMLYILQMHFHNPTKEKLASILKSGVQSCT